jgi:hypothetical protein
MFDNLRQATDRLLGRGQAAITVPVMDGTLKPNRLLDGATVAAEWPGLDDLASDGRRLWASTGSVLRCLEADAWQAVHDFGAPITALAVHPAGQVAVALDGRGVRVLHADDWRERAHIDTLGGQPLCGVNALAFDGADQLVIGEGSMRHGPAQWSRDLMTLGHSGRVARWTIGPGPAELLVQGLHHCFGVMVRADGLLVSESWRHQVLSVAADGRSRRLLGGLPGYPSRMAAAAGGGFWLSCFVCRTQLVEFVLREPAYRQRMLAEIAPEHWIAPALSSGRSFLEPLQGAGVKQMGVLKPWAPPRSYGLVLRVADDGRIVSSLHSQVDGQHHGVTAIVEHAGSLFVASKGSGRLLQLSLEDLT